MLIEILLLEIWKLQEAAGFACLDFDATRARHRFLALLQSLESGQRQFLRYRCAFYLNLEGVLDNNEFISWLDRYVTTLDQEIHGAYVATALCLAASGRAVIAPQAALEQLDHATLLFTAIQSHGNLVATRFIRARDFSAQLPTQESFGEVIQCMEAAQQLDQLDLHWMMFKWASRFKSENHGCRARLQRHGPVLESHLKHHGQYSRLRELHFTLARFDAGSVSNLERVRVQLADILALPDRSVYVKLQAEILTELHAISMTLDDYTAAIEFATREGENPWTMRTPYRKSQCATRLAKAEMRAMFEAFRRSYAARISDKETLIAPFLVKCNAMLRTLIDAAQADSGNKRHGLWAEKVDLVLLTYHNLSHFDEFRHDDDIQQEYQGWLQKKQAHDVERRSNRSKITTALSESIAAVHSNDLVRAYEVAQALYAECYQGQSQGLNLTEAQISSTRAAVVGTLIALYFKEPIRLSQTGDTVLETAFTLLDMDVQSMKARADADSLIGRCQLCSWVLMAMINKTPADKEERCEYADGYFKAGEQAIHQLRRSAQRERGMRQLLRKRGVIGKEKFTTLYRMAVSFFLQVGDPARAWSWVQRGRGRALLDMIDDSPSSAATMLDTLERDGNVRLLLSEEDRLLDVLNRAPADEYLTALRALTNHREKMRSSALGSQAILRAEQQDPVRWHELDKLWQAHDWLNSGQNLVLVDWAIDSDGSVHRLTIDFENKDSPPRAMKLPITLRTIEMWVERYMVFPAGKGARLKDEYGAFKRLAPLLAGLEHVSKTGDLLLFAPSGILSNIPLHAIPLAGPAVINRNPILYCSSITLYQTCIERVMRQKEGRPWSASAFAAAYEEPRYEVERGRIFDQMRSLKDTFGGNTVLGPALNSKTFPILLSNAPWVHYHGHGFYNAADIASQSFVLSAIDGTNIEPVGSATEQIEAAVDDSSTLQTMEAKEEAFVPKEAMLNNFLKYSSSQVTVADIFAMDLTAYNPFVYSMACESGLQDIGPGDEPLGLMTALFRAGASSIMSTFWLVESTTARAFTAAFYASIKSQMCAKEADRIHVHNLAQAFQAACLDVKASNADPYSWAAFGMHGAGFYPMIQSSHDEYRLS